jgi:hypothetical protein
MALVLTDSQQAPLQINPTTKKGNPAPIDGDPVWGTSDAEVVTLEVDPTDAKKVVAKATGKLGTAQVNVSVDADMGSGFEELVGLLDVEVVAGKAATVGIEAGAPEEQS